MGNTGIRYATGLQVIVGGSPALQLVDRGPACARDTRWLARLRGRSLGGYGVGHGPTPAAAADNLRKFYTGELAAVDAGWAAYIETTAPRKGRR